MKLMRDRRFRHLTSFQSSHDRAIRDFIITAVLLGAIAWVATVTIADLLSQSEALQLRPAIGAITTGEARDA